MAVTFPQLRIFRKGGFSSSDLYREGKRFILKMINKLFVGSLSYATTDSQLEEHFAPIGKVLSAKVITDKYSGQGKGFGFVEMGTPEEAKKAINELNGSTLDNRKIVVNEARPQVDRGQNDRGSFRKNRW